MTRFIVPSHASIPSFFSLALTALLLVGTAQASAGHSASRGSATTVVASSTISPSTCFAWSIDWRGIMGNRRRMVQVALVALCIGIAFLLKGKHG